MRLENVCTLFLKLNDSQQREFFSKYRKKRDDDIITYQNSKIKVKKEKSNKIITVKVTETIKISDEEKLLLKKLGISMSEFKKLMNKEENE
jgi:hypothetical protein